MSLLRRKSSAGDGRQPASAGGPVRELLAFRFPLRYQLVFFLLILILIVTEVVTPQVLSAVSVNFVTGLSGVLLVATIGQLLVIMSGGVDLSVPATMTMAAAAIVKISQGHNGRLTQAVIGALLIAFVIGVVNGSLIAFAKINPLIITLSTNAMVTGATAIWAGVAFSATGLVPPRLSRLVSGSLGPVSNVWVFALLVVAVAALAINRTRIGRRYAASGANPVAAVMVGIRVRTLQFAGYVIASMLYGLAGILVAGLVRAPDLTVGSPYQLTTIVTVALAGAVLTGGAASVLAVVAASLVLPLIDQILAVHGTSGGAEVLVQALVLVFAVASINVGARATDALRHRWRRSMLGRTPSTHP